MTIHYVDSNASGLNDGTSWLNAYADLSTAIAGLLVADDTIRCASNHSKNYGASQTLTFPSNVSIISVNSTSNLYEQGAIEQCSGGAYDIWINPSIIIEITGLVLKAGNNIQLGGYTATALYDDCIFEQLDIGSSQCLRASYNGLHVILNNCEYITNGTNQYIYITGGAIVIVDNLTFTTSSGAFIRSLGAGGAIAVINNTDLTDMTTGDIAVISSKDSDNINFKFNRCKLPLSGVNLVSATPFYGGQTVDFWSCDNGDGYHYFEHHRFEGKILESLTSFRDNGATYDGVTGFSAEFQPNANVVEYTNPLKFELGNYEIDLTSGATLTFHLLINDETAIATALTNSECWIEATHPDATDLALGKTVSSKATTILTTPTDLTASTATWTGEGTFTRKQQIAVTLPTVNMTGAPVSVSLCLAKDITLENANEMFVCPDPVVT